MKNIGFFKYLILAFCLCFISLPVLSGENPWDADDDRGLKYDERYVDTSLITNPMIRIEEPVVVSSNSDWFTDVITRLSFEITKWYFSEKADDITITRVR